ncbi:TPA: hypothetical protein ACH3X2_009055 [Trebouxia sp. C0005]
MNTLYATTCILLAPTMLGQACWPPTANLAWRSGSTAAAVADSAQEVRLAALHDLHGRPQLSMQRQDVRPPQPPSLPAVVILGISHSDHLCAFWTVFARSFTEHCSPDQLFQLVSGKGMA